MNIKIDLEIKIDINKLANILVTGLCILKAIETVNNFVSSQKNLPD